MKHLHRTSIGVAGLCALAGALLTPAQADACGGTFCDGMVPGPMPVDQTGENVIFVVGGAESEVHIQISYDPETNAENFGWLIPLADVPTFSVGSQPLFDQVRAATVPQYDITQSFEACETTTDGSGGGESTGFNDFTGDPVDSTGGGVDVLLQETVGAFEVAVLKDKQVGPIKAWLEANGYLWDANAEPILMQYLAEGNVIAALKLRRTAGPADVHPIVLTYPSNETCFPLRLTRIAAVENMDIRVFVLGADRAAPTNYKHVLVNPLKIDWLTRAANYKEVITNAVDAFGADGRAFVTEYAGTSGNVQTLPIYNPGWDETSFMGLDPIEVVNTLNAQGLASCFESFDCAWNHPLIFGLLLEHLPPPQGVEPIDFYPYLAQFQADIDGALWANGAGFAAGLLERVIEPGIHGEELLQTWPYLTRMYTTISPNEMMEDPIFHLNPDLPDVDNLPVANNYLLCDGDSVVTLPDNREFYIPNGGPWPQIPGEEWYAEEVQTVAIKGSPMTIVNNTSAIDKKLEEWNLAHNWPRAPETDTEGTPTTGDSGTTAGDTTSGDTPTTGGSASASGTGSDTGTTGGDTSGQTGDSGCGCRSAAPNGAWLGLAALGLLGRRRRRA